MRPEAVAGGVRHDVGESGHEDLAVIDEIVRPMANEPITRRNRPLSASDHAGIVEVDERCSDERDRHGVAGTRIHVGEHVKDWELRRRVRGGWSGEREGNDGQQSQNESHYWGQGFTPLLPCLKGTFQFKDGCLERQDVKALKSLNARANKPPARTVR
jgi:hypothetical protein